MCIRDSAIRYALGAIKRVGIAAMADIAKARANKPFKDVSDFSARIDAKSLTRGHVEILAKAGAFDSIDPNRAKIFTAAETIVRTAQAQAEEKQSGQIGLFGGVEPEKIRLPNIPDWPETDRLSLSLIHI